MAITFDALATGSTSGTSLTYSHTCAGTDRYLAVSVATHVDQGAVSGVTYNGVAMSLIGGHDGNNNTRIQLWGLANPATGANNIVVSKAGSSAIRAMSYSFAGVDQTNPVDTSQVFPRTNWTSVTTFNPSVTASVNDCVGVLAFFADGGPTLTAGSNSTVEVQEATAFGQSIARNTNPVSGTTVQISMTSVTQGFAGVLAALKNGSTSVSVTATVVSATFSIPASTVSGGATVSPSVQSVVASIQAPTVSGGATISPSVLSVVFSIPTPNIITPDAQVNVGVLSATFSIQSPVASGDADVPVGVQSATFSIPTVDFIGSVSISPDVQVATFTTLSPTISAVGNVSISASTVAATFSLQSPTVSAEQNAMASVGVLTATFSTLAVTITAERNVYFDAPVMVATFSILAPTKIGGLWTPQPRVQGTWTPQPRVQGTWTPQPRAI